MDISNVSADDTGYSSVYSHYLAPETDPQAAGESVAATPENANSSEEPDDGYVGQVIDLLA